MSVISFAKIFSHSAGCLFILFRVSFAVQKLLSLTEFHLFIFVFTVITPRGGLEMLLSFMWESVWPVFSSKSFIASGLISRSHFTLYIKCPHGVPVVAQQKQIQLGTMRSRVRSLPLLSGLMIRRCRELWCRSPTLLGPCIAVALA